MYVVIFKAKVAELDDEYFQMTERLKDLAFKKYGCQDFVSVTEDDQEIAEQSYIVADAMIVAAKKDTDDA